MGDFVGSLAGLLMFFLIIALLYKFVCDLGMKVSAENRKLLKKYAAAGAGFMAVIIFVSGIIYCFFTGPALCLILTIFGTLSPYLNITALRPFIMPGREHFLPCFLADMMNVHYI